jgi:hypothetical protein
MQNITDIQGALRRIYAHGIDVLGGFIVGFDTDTLETFEKQRKFIVESGIQAAMVGLLTALPRTPLYERLQKEGRLIESAEDNDNTRLGTNVVPKRMAYDAMLDAYRRMYQQLCSDTGIAQRIVNKLRWLRAPVYRSEYSTSDKLRIAARLMTRGIVPGGPRRWLAFIRTLPVSSPRRLPTVISDWITGLSMQSYVRRRFADADAERPSLDRRVRNLQRSLLRYLVAGKVVFAWRPAPLRLDLALSGSLDARFFARMAPRLDRLLSQPHATLTLRIEKLQARQAANLQRMLGRLAHHGDRVSVFVNESLRPLVRIDSSRFHLLLTPSADAL